MSKPTLPVWSGPGVSQCCWVSPGQEHNLSCDVVTVEQAAAYIAWQAKQREES